MVKISELLNDLFKDFSVKMNEIYEKKIEEYKMNSSHNLDSGYTKYYGELDISNIDNDPNLKYYKKYLEGVNKYLKKHELNTYIIHLCETNNNDGYIGKNSTQDINIINNYGDYINFNNTNNNFNSNDNGNIVYNVIVNTGRTFNSSYSDGKYVLPDILIDMIKKHTFHNTNMRIFSKEISVLSEDYYKKFIITQHKNKKYISQIKKLIEENKSDSDIHITKEQLMKSAYDDVLFQPQLEDFKKDISIRINEIYKKQLENEKIDTTYNLENDYTKNYGKIDISTIDSYPNLKRYTQNLIPVDEYFQKNDDSRYIIHSYDGKFGFDNKIYGIYIIDNYGDYVFNNVITVREDRLRTLKLSFSDTKSKYILPNILIDLIKKMNTMNLTMNLYCDGGNTERPHNYNILDCFKVIAEDYYKKLTQKSGSVELEELNKQYIKQIEQLTEENTKIKHIVQPQKEIVKVSQYDDVLFKEIKVLQEQLEQSKKENDTLKKEKEELSKKFSDMQSRIKEFIGV